MYLCIFFRYPGFDINAIRRKNATRETTGPLKAWLSQHKKNPYPTKGEKVMLAIATRMTLTQVSTWFANARRRMKKGNSEEYDDNDDIGKHIIVFFRYLQTDFYKTNIK